MFKVKRAKHHVLALAVRGLKAGGVDDKVREAIRTAEKALKKDPERRAQADLDACISELKKIAAGNNNIIVGPWLSEVGFEVLYWVPFLRWAVQEFDIDRERLVVISRGGTKRWYEGVCNHYFEIFDFMSPNDFRRKNEQRIKITGAQKHNVESELDEEILERCRRELGSKRVQWMHPRLMYDLFREFWRRRAPISLIENHTRFVQYKKPQEAPSMLPSGDYVAAKFYFSAAFPETEENRRFIADLVRRLSHKQPVVLLNSGVEVDDHSDAHSGAQANVIELAPHMTPSNNLDIQTLAISRAKAFIGTYGGFSYLAPFFGVPSYSFYAREDQFLPVHLDVALRACRSVKYGAFDKVKSGREALSFYGRPHFSAMKFDHFTALLDLLD